MMLNIKYILISVLAVFLLILGVAIYMQPDSEFGFTAFRNQSESQVPKRMVNKDAAEERIFTKRFDEDVDVDLVTTHAELLSQKVSQKIASIESGNQSLQFARTANDLKVEIAGLQSRIDALPAPEKLLKSGFETKDSATDSIPKTQTPEWNRVMDNYSEQTGIPRSEIDALFNN